MVQLGRRETSYLPSKLGPWVSCAKDGWSPEHRFLYIKAKKSWIPKPRLDIIYSSSND
jgi:hypothetical protein